MKKFLATTALVLVMGGSAFAALAQPLTTYQAQSTDIRASEFIGKTVYATGADMNADQAVKAGSKKQWDNVGDINDIIIGRDGNVKAVVLGVGGFLGIGEKKVAVSMNDIHFVRNGESVDDYYLVINANKDTLTRAPAYDSSGKTAVQEGGTDTAPATTSSNTSGNMTNSAPFTSSTSATGSEQAQTSPAPRQDMHTTGSTQSNGTLSSTGDGSRTRLTPPTITRNSYRTAQESELTADKLQGAHVYSAKDEDIGEVNRLVLNNQGQVQLVVLDIGGFLGVGEHHIALTPQELNIVRSDKGDDIRVYIDANKDLLKAQPEYKGNE